MGDRLELMGFEGEVSRCNGYNSIKGDSRLLVIRLRNQNPSFKALVRLSSLVL